MAVIGSPPWWVEAARSRAHDGVVTQAAPEPYDDAEYEAWQDLQAVLEERDREYWAGSPDEDD